MTEIMITALMIVCVLGLVVLGFWSMGKLDRFLAGSRRSGKDADLPEHSIRIAFENPVMAASVEDAAQAFSKKHGLVSFYFYTGSAQEIIWKLDEGAIDIGILNVDSEMCSGYDTFSLFCKPSIVTTDSAGISIESFEDRTTLPIEVVWTAAAMAPAPQEFIKQLQLCCSLR